MKARIELIIFLCQPLVQEVSVGAVARCYRSAIINFCHRVGTLKLRPCFSCIFRCSSVLAPNLFPIFCAMQMAFGRQGKFFGGEKVFYVP